MTHQEPTKAQLDEIEREGEQHGLSVQPAWVDPLEDLWTEARIALAAKKPRRIANPSLRNALDATAKRMHELFALPENWERTRGIALIHAETETLLGNFSEYRHKTVAACRKLLREEAPITVEAAERVEGSWWLGDSRKPEPRAPWHTQQRAILHVHLHELGVHAPACEVVAFISYGGIARVELASPTRFADDHGKQLIELPAGVNILDGMTLDSRLALRQELGL